MLHNTAPYLHPRLDSRIGPIFSDWLLIVCFVHSGPSCFVDMREIITIHHECPCRIEISHPRGRNFNQGRGLPSHWLNSDPEGEISLAYMDRLMMDCFSVFCRNTKMTKIVKNLIFTRLFTLFLSSRVFLSGIQIGVNVVCTLIFTRNHDWSISLVAKCKIKSSLATCAISVTLSLSLRGARSVTSLTLYDVNK